MKNNAAGYPVCNDKHTVQSYGDFDWVFIRRKGKLIAVIQRKGKLFVRLRLHSCGSWRGFGLLSASGYYSKQNEVMDYLADVLAREANHV